MWFTNVCIITVIKCTKKCTDVGISTSKSTVSTTKQYSLVGYIKKLQWPVTLTVDHICAGDSESIEKNLCCAETLSCDL